MDKFIKRFRELRISHGISQCKIAEIFNLSRNTIASYETGIRTPSIDFIIRVSDYFKVSTDYLLGVTDNKSADLDGIDLEIQEHLISILELLQKKSVSK